MDTDSSALYLDLFHEFYNLLKNQLYDKHDDFVSFPFIVYVSQLTCIRPRHVHAMGIIITALKKFPSWNWHFSDILRLFFYNYSFLAQLFCDFNSP